MAFSLAMANQQNLSPHEQPGTITLGDVEKTVEAGNTMITLLSDHKDGSESRLKSSSEFVAADQFIPPSVNKNDNNREISDNLGPALQKQLNVSENKADNPTSISRVITNLSRQGNESDTTANDKLGKKNNNRNGQQPPFRRSHRRRRRRAAAVMSSEDETEEESDSDSTNSSASSQASQDSLSAQELTQDTQTLSESPTDSSSSSDSESNDSSSKENSPPQALVTNPDQGSHNVSGSVSQKNSMGVASSITTGAGRKGRNIVLAANFGASFVGNPVSSPQGEATVSD